MADDKLASFHSQFMSKVPPPEEEKAEKPDEAEEEKAEAAAEEAEEETQEAAAEEEEEQEVEAAAEDEEPPAKAEESLAEKGLRNELIEMRKRLRQQEAVFSQNLEQLRQAVLQREAAPVQRDEYGEEEADEKDSAVLKKLESVEQRFSQEDSRRAIEGFAAQVNTSVSKFKEEHPDYDNAYQYARERLRAAYEGDGLRTPEDAEQLVNIMEMAFAQEHMAAGKDPAAAAYKLARDWGWKPNGAKKVKAAPAAKETIKKKVETLKKEPGPSMSEISGAGAKTAGVYTLEQFMSRLPIEERLKVFQDDEKFAELARTGKIAL